jgi:hypothetical protein
VLVQRRGDRLGVDRVEFEQQHQPRPVRLRAQGLVLMAAPTPPVLAADLEHGLKRLKLRAVRQLVPEVLATAKTQRWTPEELLRTLVKTIEEFQLPASSIPNPTFNYLASLEWIDAAENVVLVGPPSRLVEEIPDEGAGCEPSSPRPDTGIRGNPAFLAGHVASYSSLGPTNAPGSWLGCAWSPRNVIRM